MYRFRSIVKIIKLAGLGQATLAYVIIFFICALLVMLSDASIINYSDALWVCFQTVSTIGFGDVNLQGFVCRAVVVILSIISIFYIAIITGTVVAFCNMMIKEKNQQNVYVVGNQLENLDKLSHEELVELSRKIRKLKLK